MVNEPVNIVYPIDGSTYPIMDPAAGPLSSAYLTFSFSLTAGGGPTSVHWGVDEDELGTAKFYDQFSAQQVWKLAGGEHKFWVTTTGGGGSLDDSVGFMVGG